MMRTRRAGACAGMAAMLFAAAAAAERPIGPAALLGAWVADDPDTRSLARVRVRRDGGAFLVRVWGRCHPTDCPWGEAAALLRQDMPKPELQMVFEQGFASRRMSLRVVQPDTLAYRVETTFNDRSGRAAQVSEELLKREPTGRGRARRR